MISLTTNGISQHSPTTSPGANTSSSHSSNSSTSISSASNPSTSHFGIDGGRRYNCSSASSSNTSPPAHVPKSSSPSGSVTSRQRTSAHKQYSMNVPHPAMSASGSSRDPVSVASPMATGSSSGSASGASFDTSHPGSSVGSSRNAGGPNASITSSPSSPSRHRHAVHDGGHSRRTTSDGVPLPSPRSNSSSHPRYLARKDSSATSSHASDAYSGVESSMAVSPGGYSRATDSVTAAAPQLDLTSYPTQDLLRVLATLLAQIATANDELRPVVSAAATPAKGRTGDGDAIDIKARKDSQVEERVSVLGRRSRKAPTTAALGALGTPSSTLCFHARNVPSISIESYLLRILKYCPTTNEVFLSLLVYFDRMSRMSGSTARGDECRRKESQSKRRGGGGTDEQEATSAKDVGANRRRQDRRYPRMPASQMESVAGHSHLHASSTLIGSFGGGGASGDSSADDDEDQMRIDNDENGAEEDEEETYPGMRGFAIDSYNVHRLVIAGVTVASKFFSDVFYTNSRYAKVGGLPVHELNQLELQFLLLNDFNLVIPLDEMQRYADQLLHYGSGASDPVDKDFPMASE